MMSSSLDYYIVLGVAPDADTSTIRKAYRALVIKYHPDVFQGDRAIAEEKIREINAAYSTLKNLFHRNEYDRKRSNATKSTSTTTSTPNASTQAKPTGQTSSSPQLSYIFDIKPLVPWLAFIGMLALVHNSTHTAPSPSTQSYTPPAVSSASLISQQPVLVQHPPPAVTATSPQPELLENKMPQVHSWNAKDDGDPKTYIINGLTLTFSSRLKDSMTTPVLTVAAPNMKNTDFVGQASSQVASASFAVMKVDPNAENQQILFGTFSGGAHCCTHIELMEKNEGQWKRIDLGSWDGSVLIDAPKDIDGDGVPDIIVYDDSFDYKFAPYADSFPPPKILNIISGSVVDVSSSPRYASIYRLAMEEAKKACLAHSNGGCAAYVANASRAGLQGEAWSTMIQNYDPVSTWGREPTCSVNLADKTCPPYLLGPTPTFPQALDKFLRGAYYELPSSADEKIDNTSVYKEPIDATPMQQEKKKTPSFDCSKVHSNILILICNTPILVDADNELDEVFKEALKSSSDPEGTRQDEIVWIRDRSRAEPDAAVLLKMYQERIEQLRTEINTSDH